MMNIMKNANNIMNVLGLFVSSYWLEHQISFPQISINIKVDFYIHNFHHVYVDMDLEIDEQTLKKMTLWVLNW